MLAQDSVPWGQSYRLSRRGETLLTTLPIIRFHREERHYFLLINKRLAI
jgi:hypothetical protein